MIANLLLIRDNFYDDTTTGKLFLNGEFFSHTLEDAIRGNGIKVYGKTGIPSGTYKVELSESFRFKRVMPMVYTEPNKYELKAGGIEFKGIRIHGGNTHENTSGCPMVAERRLNDNTIQGSLEKKLTSILKECDSIEIEIINKFSF